jgi:hypothetical protein
MDIDFAESYLIPKVALRINPPDPGSTSRNYVEPEYVAPILRTAFSNETGLDYQGRKIVDYNPDMPRYFAAQVTVAEEYDRLMVNYDSQIVELIYPTIEAFAKAFAEVAEIGRRYEVMEGGSGNKMSLRIIPAGLEEKQKSAETDEFQPTDDLPLLDEFLGDLLDEDWFLGFRQAGYVTKEIVAGLTVEQLDAVDAKGLGPARSKKLIAACQAAIEAGE